MSSPTYARLPTGTQLKGPAWLLGSPDCPSPEGQDSIEMAWKPSLEHLKESKIRWQIMIFAHSVLHPCWTLA